MSTVLSLAELRARAADILPEIAAGAAERERERILPHRQIRKIAEAQLLTFRIPAAYGGAGASVEELVSFLIDLAAADSNITQALRPGYAFVEGLLAAGIQTEQERWFPRFLAGNVFGNAGWEVGAANGAVNARITPEGDHFKVNGSKYYSTGALYADWVSTVALNPEGEKVSFVLPHDREGLRLIDDFDAMGQRLTASGATHLDNVTVFREEISTRAAKDGKRSVVTPFLQLYLGAVQAGIARNALNDAAAFARDHARPIVHSTAKKSVDDPYVQFSVGEIAARAYAAEAVVLRAAAAIDRAWKDRDQLVATAVEVAQAQFIATESSLKAAELIFDVGGASTTSRRHNLDRHWRNARTVANHNPRHWKAAVAGAYYLTGAEPPASGLF
jgi:alkylation response protein AidB-like acyl-CoA dehydrogenase